jgi:two-component system, sensor histidine kinase YesM
LTFHPGLVVNVVLSSFDPFDFAQGDWFLFSMTVILSGVEGRTMTMISFGAHHFMRFANIFQNTMVRRYLLSFTLIIAIPIFLILVVFFRMFEATLVEHLSNQSLDTMSQVAQGIDEEAKRIALLASALANDEELLALVYAYSRATNRAEAFQASRQLSKQLDTLFNYTNQVGAVFFFFKEKDILYHRNSLISLSETCKREPWYQKVIQEKGKTHILQTFSLGDDRNSDGLFLSCAICPGAEAIAQGVEMIVISFKSRVYSASLLKQDRGDAGQIVIFNAENEIIFGRDARGNLHGPLPARIVSDGSQTIENDRGKFLVISYVMPYTGMKIVKLFDYAQLTGSVKQYSWYARGTLLVLVLLFFVYTGTFFRSLIRPVRKVILNMEQVGQGDMYVQVETTGIAELNSLCESFNRMVEKIRQLTKQIEVKERQRAQAEIEALQYQINPHFLANTLNSIKMMAAMVGAENIRKMTGALMHILTESFSPDGALVSLEKELDNLEQYVYIMKVRFGDSFDITLDIQAEIKPLWVLKMLLQPILENAILHGVRGLERKGELRIKGWRQADRLYLEVADNGVGIAPETLSSIWDKKAHFHKGLHCIGICNVHERIRLNYGNEYGLTIHSEIDQGTTVTLVLPVIAGEDHV